MRSGAAAIRRSIRRSASRTWRAGAAHTQASIHGKPSRRVAVMAAAAACPSPYDRTRSVVTPSAAASRARRRSLRWIDDRHAIRVGREPEVPVDCIAKRGQRGGRARRHAGGPLHFEHVGRFAARRMIERHLRFELRQARARIHAIRAIRALAGTGAGQRAGKSMSSATGCHQPGAAWRAIHAPTASVPKASTNHSAAG